MSFELFVALRYLLARRKQAFISVISFISALGVAVGVMALVIALALMTGLQGELRDRILGSTGHVYVWKTGGIEDYHAEVRRLREVPGVLGAAPAVQGKGMISFGDVQAVINLKGIDPGLEAGVTDIESATRQGSVADLDPPQEDELSGILVGRQLANQLGVIVGDRVTLMTNVGSMAPFGVVPRTPRARIAGIFELGLQEFDAEWAFVSLDFARRVMGTDAVEMIQLRVADIDNSRRIAARVQDLGDGYVAQDWSELNASLFSALWIEKMAISITIGLIVMVAALQIVASLVLLVMEKSRDIGILKTMGTQASGISRIFMMQGLIIGVVGTAVGSVAGLALCWVLDTYRLVRIPQDVYQIAYVPFVVQPLDFTIVVVSAVLICFLATIYPSRQAARLDPVQALRFE